VIFVPIEVEGGLGAIHRDGDIAILPDVCRPGYCVVYCPLFPQGISVHSPSTDVAAAWNATLEDE